MTKACQVCRAAQFLQKSLYCRLILRPFMPGITTSETNYFILIHVAESIFAARGLQHNKCKPAQRRDELGVEVAIVAHKHRGDASTRRRECRAN